MSHTPGNKLLQVAGTLDGAGGLVEASGPGDNTAGTESRKEVSDNHILFFWKEQTAVRLKKAGAGIKHDYSLY